MCDNFELLGGRGNWEVGAVVWRGNRGVTGGNRVGVTASPLPLR